MPTPGERRALIFFASVAALGVAVRGWREYRPQDSPVLAGNRTALARQIEAVDSAIAVSSSKRAPHARGGEPARGTSGSGAGVRAGRSSRSPATRLRATVVDTMPRDPRQAYWDRIAHFDSLRAAAERSSGAEKRPSPPFRYARPDERKSAGRVALPPVDLDIAGVEEAAAVPLIGSALARRIVNDRLENGPYGSIVNFSACRG